jgi:uncharacterized protein YndB with AHSA1/START domain
VGYQLDFRPGGVEINDATERDGTFHAFRGHYLDLVPNARIVRTKMTFTEQLAFSTAATTRRSQSVARAPSSAWRASTPSRDSAR